MKCLNCEHLKIENCECGCTEARCKHNALSTKGRKITWAFTVSLGSKVVCGKDRVQKNLGRNIKTPRWCPLAKELVKP